MLILIIITSAQSNHALRRAGSECGARRPFPFLEQAVREERLIHPSGLCVERRRQRQGVGFRAERSRAPTHDGGNDVGVVVQVSQPLADD